METGRETDVWVGRRFGSYQIDEVLGRGAVAVVYRAVTDDGRSVALKVLTPFAEAKREIRELFEQEWKITSRLDHPNVIRTYRYGEYRDTHYLEMDHVAGSTFGDRLRPNKRFGDRSSALAAAEVADGLQHVHDHQIVHRDVKPDNILWTDEASDGTPPHAVLFDFGLAFDQTGPPAPPGRVFGSPFWCSPEQARAEAVDHRADIYSLGASLYRLATGQAPFYGERNDLLHAQVNLEPTNPVDHGVGAALAQVIKISMAKAREDRYQSAAELAEALRSLDLTDDQPGGVFKRFRRRG